MAKLTLANVAALAALYIDGNNITIDDQTYTADRESITKLIVKIGKQLMLDSEFKDRLPELDGEELPYGTTIEEYFVNLTLATAHDPTGAANLAPDDLVHEDPFYSKELGRKSIKVTIRDNKYNMAMLGGEALASLVGYLTKRLYDSYIVYIFAVKRQLIGHLIDGVTATRIVPLAKPVNTQTGEAFMKKVKELHTEMTEFESESHNEAGVLAISPSVTLYVKGSDILPVIDVDVLAGAFNINKAEIPVHVKQLKNFGTLVTNTTAYAVMFDPRGVKLHPHKFTSTSAYNAEGEFTNFYLHITLIGFISPFINAVIFVPA